MKLSDGEWCVMTLSDHEWMLVNDNVTFSFLRMFFFIDDCVSQIHILYEFTFWTFSWDL